MGFLKGTKVQIILKLIYMAILITGLIVIVVNLSAFHFNKNQLDAIITKSVALKTQQEEKDISVTTLAVKEEHDVRVVLLQYNGKSGVETGVAIFTKLPLLSLYRYDKVFSLSTTGGAAVIDTGLTQALIGATGTDINISTICLGIVSHSLIMLVLLTLVSFLSAKIRKLSTIEGISPFFK